MTAGVVLVGFAAGSVGLTVLAETTGDDPVLTDEFNAPISADDDLLIVNTTTTVSPPSTTLPSTTLPSTTAPSPPPEDDRRTPRRGGDGESRRGDRRA